MSDQGAFRFDDPDTSREAAESVDATRLERIFLEQLLKFPCGLTAEEVAVKAGQRLASMTPRAAPLRNKGKIYDSGQRRKGESGRNRIVWMVGASPSYPD